MLKSRAGRVASVAVAATAALALSAGSASALYVSDYNTAANIRQTQWTNSAINGVGYPGHGTNSWCWVHGSSVGTGNDVWDSNTDRATGVWGYTYESYIAGAYTGQTTVC